jgi:hypothetical protein
MQFDYRCLNLNWLTTTATTIINPRKIFWKNDGIPTILSELEITPKSSTPRNEPSVLPLPPDSDIPPITQAAIDCISKPLPIMGLADPSLDSNTATH